MMFMLRSAFAGGLSLLAGAVSADCTAFTGSTMQFGTGPAAEWRTDYPQGRVQSERPWLAHDFRTEPEAYMQSVLSLVEADFSIDGDRLVGTGDEPWWVSLWMDYGSYGRERRMGLTKERGPDAGDLSPTSGGDFQVWAVGFYNALGATVLGDIFAEPCSPSLPVQVRFPRNTASIKFLFTDADPADVSYLEGAPDLIAMLDPTPSGGAPKDRVERTVRLLQLDIAIKDPRASETGWVFGTFGWVGPAQGDMLFDNLVPVSLQWGDDPGVYNADIQQSWINPALDGVMYGWPQRQTLGFNGRANGPADNIRSSCISCHASARAPRSSLGILGSGFDPEEDMTDPMRVIDHVDTWFTNRSGAEPLTPNEPVSSVLDYSLQLEAATFRLCLACGDGALQGDTPDICKSTGGHNRPSCAPAPSPGSAPALPLSVSSDASDVQALSREMAPPRQ